jgi:AP-3 complex subunit sigma
MQLSPVRLFHVIALSTFSLFFSSLLFIQSSPSLISSSLPPLLAASSPSNTDPLSTTQHTDNPSLITYRHYATLYFITISTSTESPLALLDLIQVFVEALNRLFEDVCELDLIFNFETQHAVLGEMIVGGVVIETSLDKIVKGVREQGKVVQRKESKASGFAAGGILGGWATPGLRGPL